MTDAENNVTETKYYPDSKVWRVIDAEDHDTVTNTYDANGYLIKVEDAEGNATEYEYNGFGGLKKTIYADGTYTEPSYSSIRETRSMRTRAGDTITMWYDDLNRVKRKDTPEGCIKYRYDLRGRMIETYEYNTLSPKARLIKNTYDDAGRITKVEYEGGKDVEYEYDACSNRTKLTYPDASYITYEYDNINRLTKIKNQGGSTLAEYTYDSRSRRTDLDYLNGTTLDYTYDAASRLTTIDNGTDNDDHDYDYTYDKVGNRLTMLVNGSDTHTYTYDDIYQIETVDYPGGYSFSDDTTFNYDDAGNRTSVVESGTTNYSANDLNQYDYVGSTYYDYDLNGNTTYDDVAYYSYDSENRLTSATNADGSTGGVLNAALDNMDLTFTTGGNANWAPIRPDAHDPNYGGPDSAKSGVIGANDESWLKTTMYGEGTFKFYYKKDAGTNDCFRFKIDGSTKFYVYNSSKSWEQKTYVITEVGLHTMEWSYSKGGSGTTADGGVWVDRVEWTPSSNSNVSSLQDALDTGWPVATAGDADWTQQMSSPTYNGGDSAQSGSIYDDETSSMEATVEGSGTVSFYWRVSSESGDDYLKFYLDGVFKHEISGEVDWTQKSYSVGSGTHSLVWKYVKDGGSSEGDDTAWVDYLQGPGTPAGGPDLLAEAMDSQLTFSTGGDSSWSGSNSSPYYYDGDAAHSGYIDDDEESWMQTTYTASAGDKVSFFRKVSSVESSNDELKFYIDDSLQNSISGEKDWQKKSYALSAGSRTLKWVYAKDSATSEGDDCGWVDGLYVGPSSGSLDPEPPGDYAEAVDSSLKFTTIADDDDVWTTDSGFDSEYYYDGDSARSGSISNSEESILQTIVDSASSETLKFYWKVSSDENDDYLEFYIDGTRQDRISGEVDWTLKTYTVSSGIHTLKWVYVKDYEDEDGDDCGWVDFVQWTGASPVPDSENWQQLDYKHDVYGRRSEKLIDGYATRYVYDGPHVIAEYDGNNNLLRKYIYGPGIDQAVSMIEVADSSATYYYHYDALGSVIALSDSSGDTVQTYEYSVYGEVAVEDANHTNPYMFAGRRYDIEIGLYYNRARYYNPYTGRFLQTDPIGYGDGMNMYAYCGNNPLGFTDPGGLRAVGDEEFGDLQVYAVKQLDLARDFNISDVEAMARISDRVATLTGSEPGDVPDFVDVFARLLASWLLDPNLVNWLDLKPYKANPDQVEGFGDDGFKSIYLQEWKGEPCEATGWRNQVNHFVGFMAAGYHSPTRGRVQDFLHDWETQVGGQGIDSGDYRLGLVAIDVGAALYRHRNSSLQFFTFGKCPLCDSEQCKGLSPAQVGNWIRNNLANPNYPHVNE